LTTKKAIKIIYNDSKYIADPHGAVAYLGLRKYQENNPKVYGIFLETAHPVKFLPVVEDTINITLEIPEQIEKIIHKKKAAIQIATYEDLKDYLLNNKPL